MKMLIILEKFLRGICLKEYLLLILKNKNVFIVLKEFLDYVYIICELNRKGYLLVIKIIVCY